jgi:hypothetical protein
MQVHSGARAVLLFAIILLGLKAMLGGVVRRHEDVVSEAVDGVLLSVITVLAFPVLVPQLIELTNAMATAVGTVDLSRYMHPGLGNNPIVEAILFVVLVFFGVRLLFRAAWRIMVLAVLLPVGMAVYALYAVPGLRWFFIWWAKVADAVRFVGPLSGAGAPSAPTPAPTGAPVPPQGVAAQPHDARYFQQTGYRIANDAFWSYFRARGGERSFGFPCPTRSRCSV